MPKKVAIIGGGAAGLMCAATLFESGADLEIHLFEKNIRLGSKVIISGGGRCNVTTGIRDMKELFTKYIRGGKFLRTAIGQFSPEKVYDWFEEHGVPLKIEKDGRVFPVSDDGKDVVGVFEGMFSEDMIHFRESVLKVEPKGDDACLLISDKAEYEFDFVVICTGGNAYSHTGSTGDGYDFARSFGHTITRLGPSLNSFLCSEDWPKELSGLSLSDARIETEALDAVSGPLLFTHFGVSGPMVFALSAYLAFDEITEGSPSKVKLYPLNNIRRFDFEEDFKSRIQSDGAKQILSIMKDYLPARFAQVILDMAELPSEKKASEISKKDMFKVVELLFGGIELTFIKRRAGDEFVTAGGVSLDEVDSKTMQSKLHKSLYFAGEVLDVDGVTGGFNLQASWATGRLAGKSISQWTL